LLRLNLADDLGNHLIPTFSLLEPVASVTKFATNPSFVGDTMKYPDSGHSGGV
jgi:hypothetical protein